MKWVVLDLVEKRGKANTLNRERNKDRVVFYATKTIWSEVRAVLFGFRGKCVNLDLNLVWINWFCKREFL